MVEMRNGGPPPPRTVLVTGATGVIGLAICHRLASEGVTLVVHHRRPQKHLPDLVADLATRTARVVTIQADLTDDDGCDKLFSETVGQVGNPDVVVHNAGVLRPAAVSKVDDQDWAVSVAVNLTAAMRLTRAALPHLIERRWGRLVYVSSVSAVRGRPFHAAYAASKAGLIGLARTTALESARFQVTANVVVPGFVKSPMSDPGGSAAEGSLLDSIPMRRPGTATEVAAAVGYLCSDDASYVTGQVLAVDGGVT